MSGTLEEVLEKVFELNMENRMDEATTERFLLRLKHEDNTFVFNGDDVIKMLDLLKKAKEEK